MALGEVRAVHSCMRAWRSRISVMFDWFHQKSPRQRRSRATWGGGTWSTPLPQTLQENGKRRSIWSICWQRHCKVRSNLPPGKTIFCNWKAVLARSAGHRRDFGGDNPGRRLQRRLVGDECRRQWDGHVGARCFGCSDGRAACDYERDGRIGAGRRALQLSNHCHERSGGILD